VRCTFLVNEYFLCDMSLCMSKMLGVKENKSKRAGVNRSICLGLGLKFNP
jgi:hypothetical protein